MDGIVRRSRPLLGTFVEISVRNGGASVFAEAYETVEHVHRVMSAHLADSDLAVISREAHRGWVTVDAATAEVLRLSLRWAELSEDAFDPVRAGVELVRASRRPCFTDNLPDVGATWRDVEVDGLRVRSRVPLAIDLGGVAKGYAVDLAAAVIGKHGCQGIVNAGGDIRFIGDEERRVCVRRPDAEGQLLELSGLPRPALATTAGYAFSDEGGNRDLVGGNSAMTGFSITVFAESCALADAMTKVVLNLPEEKAADLLGRMGCDALILSADGGVRELP